MENLDMMMANVNPSFWQGKRVFLTGHTGFKGGWLSLWLTSMGAKVTGYALSPNTKPSLYEILGISDLIERSCIDDVCNLDGLKRAMIDARPEILIHMAAQPLVRFSYQDPVLTYATNVMGTVNVLEVTRGVDSIRATVIVTTDKCYENKEWVWGYREGESMGGHDPYSSSKGCAELVTAAYRNSYFSADTYKHHLNAIATARAGNVIGGGDWSPDRLIPDAIKAFEENKPVMIRNPMAIRPWQHVLEPLSGYLILAQALYESGASYASAWNFGPRDEDAKSVKEVMELLIQMWGKNAAWSLDRTEQSHEARLLKLDCSKANTQLKWLPRWDLETAIQKIVDWEHSFRQKEDMLALSLKQINQYMNS
jgi:CDP-glucose 4,6-dehydratase